MSVLRAQQHRWKRRLISMAVLALWLGVSIAVFGFHHHAEGEDCDDVGCPIALVVFNLPILVAALALLTGDVPHLTDLNPRRSPIGHADQVLYLRGPPRLPFA